MNIHRENRDALYANKGMFCICDLYNIFRSIEIVSYVCKALKNVYTVVIGDRWLVVQLPSCFTKINQRDSGATCWIK